ncbi:MAG: right-handed parallel beta-helix repeat-containing protein [Marinilabiliaceae bacterium]|nr:right-handed parallel beta-helix repeat-containing protein [Marinilabiliaceae bacterium]
MRLITTFMLVALALHGAQAATYDVRIEGAKGDGKSLDSHIINRTIEKCAMQGGGIVTLPAGTYLCGSIRMKSNVELNLQAGAIIVATSQRDAYDPSEPFNAPEYQDGGHTYFHNSLIWGENLENIAITGRGTIDGLGLTRNDTETAGNVQGGSIGMADKAIALKRCRNLLIRDITISRGGHFAIIITGCDYAHIDNVVIDTNRDGIDIDCCRYSTISNCKVNTPHDDAIVLKSSYALNEVHPCESIMITNCLVTGYKLGTTLNGKYIPEVVNWVCGRIKLGTESNGGYRNITINNCICIHSSGIALEEVDQGVMENITISNIAMQHVHHYPIYITTGCRNRGPKDREAVSTARNILISNIVADDCDSLSGIQITGMPNAPISNVTFRDIIINSRGGAKTVDDPNNYPELGSKYPEIAKFLGICPTSCLFIRHAKDIHIENVRFSFDNPDERQSAAFIDTANVYIANVDYGQ